jgi:hypothetical protein
MNFTAQQLMYIFDAVCTYSILPNQPAPALAEKMSEEIGTAIEAEMAKRGYTFECIDQYQHAG